MELLKRESTNLHWSKLAFNYGMLVFMIVTKVARGPGSGQKSIVGLSICNTFSWSMFGSLILVAVVVTVFAAKIANKEF